MLQDDHWNTKLQVRNVDTCAFFSRNAGWFHENNMGAFALRMNFLTFVFSCVTLVEVFHMEHIRLVLTS